MIRGWRIGIVALVISAQAEVPKGVPALLEATNGKQRGSFCKVQLQHLFHLQGSLPRR